MMSDLENVSISAARLRALLVNNRALVGRGMHTKENAP